MIEFKNLNITDSDKKCLIRAEKILINIFNSTPEHAITSPDVAKNIFKTRLSFLEREEFHVMYLNNQNKIISVDVEFLGTIDSASVYPREIVKKALKYNSNAIIIAHNHPSGILQPSSSDIAITNKIRECLNLLDIRLLDHIIVAKGDCLAFSEKGLMS